MSARVAGSSWPALGTTAGFLVVGAAAHDRARRALETELAAIDVACSRFREDSELTALNTAGGRPLRVSALFQEAIAVALRAAVLTDGRVDPTVGAALELSGYDRDFARIHDAPARRVRVRRVPGWRVIEVDREAGTVRVPAGVRIDLGATAKALAADRAAERILRETSASGVLVNLGGDIATRGQAPAGGWPIRVADSHRATAEDAGQSVSLPCGALSTSSITVRRWRAGSDEVHHIVDPSTGRCASGCWRTVSVAAASCVDANIASTAAIVLGSDARSWLAAASLPARLVALSGAVAVTSGWPSEGPVPS